MAVVVLVVLALGAMGAAWWLLFSPNGVPATKQLRAVSIAEGSSTAAIARQLYRDGMISDRLVFRARVRFAGADAKLKAGRYRIAPGTGYDKLIKLLEAGPAKDSVRVTIPEGKTIEQSAAILAEKLDFSAEDFTAFAKSAAPTYADRYPFLEGAYAESLEGFLFPDTYEFDPLATPQQVVEVMLRRFADIWVDLQPRPATTASFSDAQIVTIASLVERETSVDKERALVSSVIYNRLGRGMRLQLCSSVQFLLPGKEKSKLRLTNADIATESPYNTYLHDNLPPGPIANPGRDSLAAALRPKKTKYLYFVLTGKDGSQTFAAGPAEFEKAKAKSKQVFGQ